MLNPLALGALAVLPLLAPVPLAAQEQTPRRLVVTGTGEASARPDVAVISAGVVAQAETASAALAENTQAMNRVFEQLRAAGLPPEDLQTAQFAVTPLYESRQPDPQTTQPPRIVGYQVSNQVRARVRDIDRLGATLDALVGAGANSIDGLSFDLADPKQVLGEARDAAVADALAKAKRYAPPPGYSLGDHLDRGGRRYPPPRPMMRAEAMAARRADRARPDRAVGQRDDHVRARLTESRRRPSTPAACAPARGSAAWTNAIRKAWRCGLRRSEFVQQRLAAGLVFALGDVALGSQVIEDVQLMLDRARRRPCRRRRGHVGRRRGDIGRGPRSRLLIYRASLSR